MTRVLHLSTFDIQGGAARATYRIHQSQLRSNINSTLMVNKSIGTDANIVIKKSTLIPGFDPLKPRISSLIKKIHKTDNTVLHSISALPSHLSKYINKSSYDLVNLHWVQDEFISIRDIGKIDKPIVWTMHDMWPFCGAEHYSQDSRYISGYTHKNFPEGEKGLDLNRWTWEQKRKYWKNHIHMVGNCNWISNCAKNSALMSNYNISTIPNAINTDCWRPTQQRIARSELGLNTDKPLMLFSILGGSEDYRKGGDLLLSSLATFKAKFAQYNLELVFMGKPSALPRGLIENYSVHCLGSLDSDASIIAAYNACDVVAIPSRQETLTNVGVEAHSCGIPIVSYGVCGLLDIVSHKRTGYLATPYDFNEFAYGIKWVLDNTSKLNMRLHARERAVNLWSYDKVSHQYLELYRTLV